MDNVKTSLRNLVGEISGIISHATKLSSISHNELKHLEGYLNEQDVEEHTRLISNFVKIGAQVNRIFEDRESLGHQNAYDKIYTIHIEKLLPAFYDLLNNCSDILLVRPKELISKQHGNLSEAMQILETKILKVSNHVDAYEKSQYILEVFKYFENNDHYKKSSKENDKEKSKFVWSSPLLFLSTFIIFGSAGAIAGLIWFDYATGLRLGAVLSLVITIILSVRHFRKNEINFYPLDIGIIFLLSSLTGTIIVFFFHW